MEKKREEKDQNIFRSFDVQVSFPFTIRSFRKLKIENRGKKHWLKKVDLVDFFFFFFFFLADDYLSYFVVVVVQQLALSRLECC